MLRPSRFARTTPPARRAASCTLALCLLTALAPVSAQPQLGLQPEAQPQRQPAPVGDMQPGALPDAEALRRPAPEVTVDDALARARAAYASGPTIDAVRLIVSGESGAVARRGAYRVALDPASRTARLELGDLVVVAHEGRLLAAHAAEPALLWSRPLGDWSPGALEPDLPALLLPQWALALGDTTNLAPLIGPVTWNAALTLGVGPQSPVLLRGRTAAEDAVFLTLDGVSGRITRLVIDRRPSRLPRLELNITPQALPEGFDARALLLDETGRERVATLPELAPRPGPARVGGRFPDAGFTTETFDPASLEDVFGAPAAADAVALIAYDPARPGDPGAAAIAATEALRRALREARAQRPDDRALPRVALRVVVLNAVDAGAAVAVANEVARWRQQADAPTLWTTAAGEPGAAGPFESLAPGAGVALVMLTRDRVVRAAARLDGLSAEALRTAVDEALRATLESAER